MSPELRAVVDDAYRVFGGYGLEGPLTVCHCNCCMSDTHEQQLIAMPLRSIPAPVLAEYTNSAHTWDDEAVAREMRYFLPRYLELMAANDPPDNMGLDICLRRLGDAGWRDKWPAAELDVLDSFFDRLIAASVLRLELAHWPVGWKLAFDLADVLTCAVTAGGNLDRVLASWEDAVDPPAAIHMAALREDGIEVRGRPHFYSAYLEDHPEAAEKIGAFLMRPAVDTRIEAAFFAVDDWRLQKILSDANPRTPG